jgi:hypothetical protein
MRAAQGLKTASESMVEMADTQGFNDSFRKIAELYDEKPALISIAALMRLSRRYGEAAKTEEALR